MKKKAIHGVLIRSCGLVLSMGTSILLARSLQPHQFGHYAFLLTIVELLTIIALFGSPTLILREVAAGLARQDYARVRGIVQWAARNTFLLSIPLMGLAWLGIYIRGEMRHDFIPNLSVLLAMALIPLGSFNRQWENIIQGAGRVVASQGFSILIGGALFFLMLVFLSWFHPHMLNLTSVLLLMGISQGVACVALAIKARAVLPDQIFEAKPVYFTRQWLKSSLPLLLVGSLLIINTRIDIVMLGYMRDSADVGIYRIAQRGGQYLLIGIMAVDSILNPMAARAWAKQDLATLQVAVRRSVWLCLALTLPFLAIYLLLGRELIQWLYGQAYASAWLPLVILSTGYLSLALLGRGGVILTMSHFEKQTAIAIGIGALANVILNLVLITRFGINGAATATAIAVTIRMVMEAILAYKKTGVDTTIFSSFVCRKMN